MSTDAVVPQGLSPDKKLRRKILRCHVTRHPTALWIVQQMREAWPYIPVHRFLLFDRDAKFGNEGSTGWIASPLRSGGLGRRTSLICRYAVLSMCGPVWGNPWLG